MASELLQKVLIGQTQLKVVPNNAMRSIFANQQVFSLDQPKVAA